MNYVEPAVLREFGEATEADDSPVWDVLAASASRLFDKTCGVDDDFFKKAGNDATEKTFRANGTEYLQLAPYIANSITAITVDGESVTLADGSDSDEYDEVEGFLIFNYLIAKGKKIAVTARWGFAEIPDDVKQAVISQALFMWRRKDLQFAEISGVSGGIITAEVHPDFNNIANKYRELYNQRGYFA